MDNGYNLKVTYYLLNNVPLTELVYLCQSSLLPAWHTTKSWIYVYQDNLSLEPQAETTMLDVTPPHSS